MVKTLQKIDKLVNWKALVEIVKCKDKRKELEQKSSSQVDTDAHSTEKGGKKYFD